MNHRFFLITLFLPALASAEVLPIPAVTSSSTPFSGSFVVGNLFDSNPSEFASAGAGVGTFVNMDFGSDKTMDRCLLMSRPNAGDVVLSYELQFSTNATFGDSDDITHIATTVGGNGEGNFANFPSITVRYVRWRALSVTGANIGGTELRFLNTAAGQNRLTPQNISGSSAFNSSYALAYASDQKAGRGVGNEYASLGAGVNTFVDFDFGSSQQITGFDFFDRIGANDRASTFNLVFSNDPSFSPVIATKSYTPTTWGMGATFPAVTARYVRFDVTSVPGSSTGNQGISEIIFYTPQPTFASSTNLYFDLNGSIFFGFGTSSATHNWLDNLWNTASVGAGSLPPQLTIWDEGSAAFFPAAGSYSVDPGAGIRYLSGLSVSNGSPTFLSTGEIKFSNAAAGLDIASGSTATIQTALSGTPSSLTKSGTGTLVLAGANFFQSPLTLTAGTLRLGSVNAFPAGGSLNMSGTSTLDLNGYNLSLPGLSGISTSTVTLGTNAILTLAKPIEFDVSSFIGSITGGTGSKIIKTGLGTQIVKDIDIGTLEIPQGIFQIGNGGASGNSSAAVTLGTGSTAGSLYFNTSNNIEFSGSVSGNGKIYQQGAQILTLTNTNIGAGITIDSPNGSVKLDPTTAMTYSGSIGGGGGPISTVFFTGGATPADALTLTGANSYGSLTQAAGFVKISGGTNRLPTTSTMAVADGTAVTFLSDQTLNAITDVSGSTSSKFIYIENQKLTLHVQSSQGNDALGDGKTFTYNGRLSTNTSSKIELKSALSFGTATFIWPRVSGVIGQIIVGAGTRLNITRASNFLEHNGNFHLMGETIGTVLLIGNSNSFSGTGQASGLFRIATANAQTKSIAPGENAGSIGKLTFSGGLDLAFTTDGFVIGNIAFDLDLAAPGTSDLVRIDGGTFTMPTGAESRDILVRPNPISGFANGTYTLIDWTGAALVNMDVNKFTLSAPPTGKLYSLAINGTQLQLTVSSTPIAQFRSDNGLAADGSQDLATPTNDGTANLLKFAFNLIGSGIGQKPTLATSNRSILTATGSAGLPLVQRNTTSGLLEITYIRHKSSSSGVTYTVQFSNNLVTWTPATSPALGSGTSVSTAYERVTVADSSSTPPRFGRIKVNVP